MITRIALALVLGTVASAAQAGDLMEDTVKRHAATYMQAFVAPASTPRLDLLFERWSTVAAYAMRNGGAGGSVVEHYECWLTKLEADHRRLGNPRIPLVIGCFELDPVGAVTTADYRR